MFESGQKAKYFEQMWSALPRKADIARGHLSLYACTLGPRSDHRASPMACRPEVDDGTCIGLSKKRELIQ